MVLYNMHMKNSHYLPTHCSTVTDSWFKYLKYSEKCKLYKNEFLIFIKILMEYMGHNVAATYKTTQPDRIFFQKTRRMMIIQNTSSSDNNTGTHG